MELIHPEDRPNNLSTIEKALERKESYHLVYRIRSWPGRDLEQRDQWKWVLDRGEGIFSHDGELKALEGFITDISDQKLREIRLREENTRLRSSMTGRYKIGNIIGRSPGMTRGFDLIMRAAADNANVIIYGDSGTGKELVARAIHDAGERRKNAFIPVNCGAIPENLMESEFFGHKKGGFSGAYADKGGYLDLADQGTLFLDELGEISLNIQVKLLRVHVIPIHLPPLRERMEDIPLLADHFLKALHPEAGYQSIPARLRLAFETHDWPGNVRELRNMLERYRVLGETDFVEELEKSGPGAHDNASLFPEDVPTMAHYLRDLGYATCLSGKMHFIGADQQHGFEERLTTDIYPADFGWTPDWTDFHTRPVSLVDLMPTLAELGSGGRPTDFPGGTDGSSLVPLLRGGMADETAAVYSEILCEGAVSPVVMIRRGAYKYIHCQRDPEQLYNLDQDPHETRNLAALPGHAVPGRPSGPETHGCRILNRPLHRPIIRLQNCLPNPAGQSRAVKIFRSFRSVIYPGRRDLSKSSGTRLDLFYNYNLNGLPVKSIFRPLEFRTNVSHVFR